MFSFIKNIFKPHLVSCQPFCDGVKVGLVALYSDGSVLVTDCRNNNWRKVPAKVFFSLPYGD